MNEHELKEHLRDKKPYSVYLFHGEEAYLKKFYSDKIIGIALEEIDEGINYYRLDGKTVTEEDIFDIALRYSMFGSNQVVFVDDFNFSSLEKKAAEAFAENIRSLPETTILIFYQDTVPVKSTASVKKILEAIETAGAVAELKKRSGTDLYNPLISYAKKQGCELSKELAMSLVEMVGDEFNMLLIELDKICSYKGSGKITLSDIEAVAIKTPLTKLYYLTDNLLSGKFDKAYECFDILRRNKTEPEYILGVIVSCYVDMYRLRTVNAGGAMVADLKNSFDYKGRDFVLQKAQKNMRGYTLAQLKGCLSVLSEADMKLKLSRDDPYFIIEQLLVKLILVKNQ